MSTPDPTPSATGSEGSESPEDVAAQQALAAAAQAADGDTDDDDDDDSRWDEDAAKRKFERMKADAAKLRERIKSLQPLAEEAEKRRKGEMTEAQKLAEEKAALEVELAELKTVSVRREAAEAADLPARFVKFLTAAEPVDALAQAKELAKELKGTEPEQQQPRKADLRQGARGAAGAGSSMSPDDLLRQMAGRP